MAEKQTIARPYASALFEVAKDSSEMKRWAEFLDALEFIVTNENFSSLVGNPIFTDEVLFEIVMQCLLREAEAEEKNFIRLMLDSGRISILPEIRKIFGDLYRQDGGVLTAEVITPYPLTAHEVSNIQSRVSTKFGRNCVLDVSISPTLIGGVIVKVGDAVIDLSVKGRLKAFERQIS